MISQLFALSQVLDDHRSVLFERWRKGVSQLPSAVNLDAPALRDHIPQFIDEMIKAIGRWEESENPIADSGSPIEHGIQRLAVGFDIKEVVIEYNILRGAVHDVAESVGMHLSAAECHVINHIIDDAIAWAVDTFAKEQALELQRRREEYFAFIAHDVRTPLNAISLTAQLLEQDLAPAAKESADMLRALQRNVLRIEELILRVMEEEQRVEPVDGIHLMRREVDLWPLVQRLLLDLAPVTESEKIKVSNFVPRHLVVDADAGLLGRALQNFISNSIKFAPGGEIEIGAQEKDHGIECWVRDTGSGIAPERLQRIFEKRETDPDPSRAGFGLGLAISKQIIEAHGGEITVESLPQYGSTFHFVIPRQNRPQSRNGER